MIKLFSKKPKKETAPAIARTAALSYRYPADSTPGFRIYAQMMDDPLVRLERLAELFRDGALSVEEFEQAKAPLLDEMGGHS